MTAFTIFSPVNLAGLGKIVKQISEQKFEDFWIVNAQIIDCDLPARTHHGMT